MDKAALRQEIKHKLQQLAIDDHSRICKELTHQVSKFLKSQSHQSLIVASFLPLKGEIAPDPKLLRSECPHITWVYPVEVEGEMKFAETSGELGVGPWLKTVGPFQTPQIILMPGLAFDRMGHRLGRGRSYYDQYLKNSAPMLRVAVTWSELVVDQVPVEEHDQSVDEIITEQSHWSVSGQCFLEGE